MYDINFIRERIVPESRRKAITAIVSITALTLGMTLASVGTMSLSDLRAAEVYAADIDQLKENMTTRYSGIPSEDELRTIIGQTEPYLRDIGKMVDTRIAVTPIWERIALAVPDGVWLTRVTVADPRSAGDEVMRGGQNTFRGIMIEGVALAGRGPEGDKAVAAFVDNLKKDEELSSIVTGVESVGTGLEQVGDTSVVGFEITCPF
jgi:hypothetical protein